MRDGREFTVGSLFSGIEGFGLGFTLAGATIKWASEIDPWCTRTSAKRFPGTKNIGDISDCDAATLGDVDCITFGFPCQDLSVAGHRAGLDGARSGLFWEALRIIASKRPRWIVAENVPGLLSSNEGLDFGVILWALAAVGYGVAYAELDAQHHGVPQRRRRIFIVGCLGDASRARKVLADAHGGYRHSAQGTGTERGTTGELGDRLAAPLYYTHDYSQERIYDADDSVSPAVTVGKREVFGTLRSNHRNNSNPVSSPLVWGAVTARDGKGPDSDGRGIGDDAAPIAFDTKQDPVSGPRSGAIGSIGRQGVAHPRGHPAGPTNLQPPRGGRPDADDGQRHGGDELGPPNAACAPDGSTGPDADGAGRRHEADALDAGPLVAAVDSVGDRAPTGLPGWLDLPMWQGAEEPWRLHVDRVAVAPHSGEEGGEGSGDAGRRTMDGGVGAVAGQLDSRERERERPQTGRTVTTGTGAAGRGAPVIAQTRPATAPRATPSASPSPTGSPNASSPSRR